MMSLVRRVIYAPPVNLVIRTLMRPFRSALPTALKIPVAGTISVDTEVNGSIKLATNQTNRLSQDVFWGGIRGYEYPSLRVLAAFVTKAECFIDVGANIGYYSLLAARLNPNLRAYAFEPMPGAWTYLLKNIDLNGFSDRITPVRMAVADGPGEVEFFVTKNPKALHLEHHLGGSSSTARAKDQYSQTVVVQMGSLDDFVEERGIKRVDILKLDTEATEDKVLAGAAKLIRRDRPLILCEVLPGRIENELERIFREHGYVAFLPDENGLERMGSVVGHSDSKDFLFVHETRLSELENLAP